MWNVAVTQVQCLHILLLEKKAFEGRIKDSSKIVIRIVVPRIRLNM